MTTLVPVNTDPIDLPAGATIRRPDPLKPFVAMSNRDRWGKCAVSAVLPQIRTPSGPAAEEGTEAHKVAEWAVALRIGGAQAAMPTVVPPPGLRDFDYSPEGVRIWQHAIHDHALTYAEKAHAMMAGTTGPTIARPEVKIENVVIHGVRVYTIADLILWNPASKRLISGDYKYGRSPVGVGTVREPNPQVAGGAVLWADQAPHLQPEQIGLFVYQPRTRYGDAWQQLVPLGAQWLSGERTKLHAELEAVAEAAEALAGGKLVDAVPGDHCTYCPSARWCSAAANYGATALAVEEGRLFVTDMSPEEIMAVWVQRPAFKQFEDDLRERVKMLSEKSHPAVTVKRRIGNPMWANPAAVVEQLMMAERFDLLEPVSIGKAAAAGALPAAALKSLQTRAPDVLTYVASGGKDIALATDAFAKYLPKE